MSEKSRKFSWVWKILQRLQVILIMFLYTQEKYVLGPN